MHASRVSHLCVIAGVFACSAYGQDAPRVPKLDAELLKKMRERLPPREPPALQRVIVTEAEGFWFRDETRKFVRPATLMRYTLNLEGPGGSLLEYDLHGNWAQVSLRLPMRWTISKGHIVTGLHQDLGRLQIQVTEMQQWPIDLLVPGPDRRYPLDQDKVRMEDMYPMGELTRIRLWPIDPEKVGNDAVYPQRYQLPVAKLVKGFYVLTETGYEYKPPGGYRDAFYDLQPGGEGMFDLFIAVEGRLSLWRGNRNEWEFVRILPGCVDRPFLVLHEGRKLVTERGDDWVLMGPLGVDEPEVRVIVPKDSEHPLFAVEDWTAGEDYFRLGDRLMNRSGAVIEHIDTSRSSDDQMREVVQRVVSRRE